MQDGVAVDQYRLMDPVAKFREQPRSSAIPFGAVRHARQQMIDGGREQRHFGTVRGRLDAAADAAADRNALDLLRYIIDGQQRPALKQVQHRHQACDQAK